MTEYMLLRHRDVPDINQIDVFLKEDGFEGLKKALKTTIDTTMELIEKLREESSNRCSVSGVQDE